MKGDIIETVKRPVYIFGAVIIYVSYGLIGLGLYHLNPIYLHWISVGFHVLMCLFLIYRFNPLVKPELRPFDNEIIFGCGMVLLFNVVVSEIGLSVIDVPHVSTSTSIFGVPPLRVM